MEFVERWLYNVPQKPPQTRTKPMKVLALGMSRSGTESLRRALQMLGYDHVYHGFDIFEPGPPTWRDWVMLGRRKYGMHGSAESGDSGLGRDDFDAILGHSEAVTDQPCTLFAAELIRAYPEALVVLNRRDVDPWYQSACKVFTPLTTGLFYHVFPWFHAGLYWESRYVSDCFQQFFYHSLPRHGKWVYEEHCAKIKGLAPPDRLLEWTVDDGWDPLCK